MGLPTGEKVIDDITRFSTIHKRDRHIHCAIAIT